MRIKLSLVCVLLLCLCSFLSPTLAKASTVTIPIEQWMQLRANNNELVMRLAELELRVQELRKPTSELQQRLNVAKLQLAQSQAALRELNGKLESAAASQHAASKSLEMLTVQLEAERTQARKNEQRLRLQRNAAYLLAVIVAIRN